jgi:hypothetical protein
VWTDAVGDFSSGSAVQLLSGFKDTLEVGAFVVVVEGGVCDFSEFFVFVTVQCFVLPIDFFDGLHKNITLCCGNQ